MKLDPSVLSNTERIRFALRTLYVGSGYEKYAMSRFEEYDLYSRNKDFLVSDNVITFTDTNGRLMALKPDVTLSIIQNSRDESDRLRKLCYDESVYRVSKKTGFFKEILQSGLECIGRVDGACLTEVVSLAADSLRMLSGEYVLVLSDMDMVLSVLDSMGAAGEARRGILRCAGERNLHGIDEICEREGIGPERRRPLKELLSVYGRAEKALPELERLCPDGPLAAGLEKMKRIVAGLRDPALRERIEIDLSLIGDGNYYNGLVFRGFLDGVPDRVLSGGQYDRLMEKMGRKASAVGFAVYLDELERIALPDDLL